MANDTVRRGRRCCGELCRAHLSLERPGRGQPDDAQVDFTDASELSRLTDDFLEKLLSNGASIVELPSSAANNQL